MFNQAQRPTEAKGSAFTRGISLLGGALGVGAAILATPPLFNALRGSLLSYLTQTWGPDVGGLLTWAFAGVLAVVTYVLVKLGVVLSATWAAAALAARRFPMS